MSFNKRLIKNELIRDREHYKNLEIAEIITTTTITRKKVDNRPPVLTSLPNLNMEPDMKMYPWHLKISIDSILDFSGMEKLKEEFALQLNLERKLTVYLERKCKLKKVVSYHKNNQNVHHWYINCCEGELSMDNSTELDSIKKEHNINFEFKNDEHWNEVAPLLKSIKESVMDYNTIVKHFDN